MSLPIHIDSLGERGVPGMLCNIGRGVLVASGSSFQVHWGYQRCLKMQFRWLGWYSWYCDDSRGK